MSQQHPISRSSTLELPNNHNRNGGYTTTGTIGTTTTTTSNSSSSKMNTTNNNNNDNENDDNEEEEEEVRRIAQLSNTALEELAHSMQNESNQLSISLTQQLSTTVSGQHLLHTISSLQYNNIISNNIHTAFIPQQQHSNNNSNSNSNNTPLLLDTCVQYENDILLVKYHTIQQQIIYIQQNIIRYQQIQSMIQILQDIQTVETTLQKWRNNNHNHNNNTKKQQPNPFLSLISSSSSSLQQQQHNNITTAPEKNPESTQQTYIENNNGGLNNDHDNNNNENIFDTILEDANTLERTAMMVITLTHTLQYANERIMTSTQLPSSDHHNNNNTTNASSSSSSPPPLEYEQCIVSCCTTRIRRIEKDFLRYIQEQYEFMLQTYKVVVTTTITQQQQQQSLQSKDVNIEESSSTVVVTTTDDDDVVDTNGTINDRNNNNNNNKDNCSDISNTTNGLYHHHHHHNTETTTTLTVLLLVYGHYIRSLMVLGRQKDIISIFIKIMIQPIIYKNITIRNIDYGGTRGECTNLYNVMHNIYNEIANQYQPLLYYTEQLFTTTTTTVTGNVTSDTNNNNINNSNLGPDLDLITMGIWIPLIQTIMNDASIRMSIFSPGIANIVQTNYHTLVEDGLYHFCEHIFTTTSSSSSFVSATPMVNGGKYNKYYNLQQQQQQQLSQEQIRNMQERIYQHPLTSEFMKRWNLPIYYQLRFGECTTRINTLLEQTKIHGWSLSTSTVSSEHNEDLESRYTSIRQSIGFELLLFLDLYDTICTFWQPHIFIKPLTNRFLRGTIQVLGRLLAFVKDGMDGTLLFGAEEATNKNEVHNNNDSTELPTLQTPPPPLAMTRKPYCWGESETDVASVMWELSILESALQQDYVAVVCDALLKKSSSGTEVGRINNEPSHSEMKELVNSILKEASEQINPIIDHGWNNLIVNMITTKCAGPLAAVKGVAATYRMTNRPPPTMSSPFVITILRPLREFDTEFHNRIPTSIGTTWKQKIVSTISDRYAMAVDDLIATVQRAEESLLKRKGGRASAIAASIRSSGVTMSDGEKVKLQLFLDYETYVRCVHEVGIDPFKIDGIVKLGVLTKEGETLRQVSSK